MYARDWLGSIQRVRCSVSGPIQYTDQGAELSGPIQYTDQGAE
jgi:hypothetical protein